MDVQGFLGVSSSKMTYIMPGGALNSSHSLIHCPILQCDYLMPKTVLYFWCHCAYECVVNVQAVSHMLILAIFWFVALLADLQMYCCAVL